MISWRFWPSLPHLAGQGRAGETDRPSLAASAAHKCSKPFAHRRDNGVERQSRVNNPKDGAPKDGAPAGDPGFDWSRGAAAQREAVYRPPEYLVYLEKATDALKLVRIIVFAGMSGFLLLAMYGFFLIFQLTGDVRRAVDQIGLMTQQMQAMTMIMANMHGSIADVSSDMAKMNASLSRMETTMDGMSKAVSRMDDTVALMQHSASNIDQSIGPMMGTVNRFMPFGLSGSDYGGAPPYATLSNPGASGPP